MGVRTRAAALLCCVAVPAALLAGCGGGGGTVREDPQRMLNRHAAAVLKHDEAAFLADVAPAQRAAQRTVYRNLARLPLASWSYRLVRRTGTTAKVQLSYRLTGYDSAPVTSAPALTLAPDGGRWDIAGGSPAELWDQGTLRVVRGTHSLVLGVGASQASLKAYAADVDRAVTTVSGVWGDGWARRVVVEVPGSLRDMAALLDASPTAYQGIAAVTTAELRGSSASVPADRVVVNPEAFGELSVLGRRVVLTHETTHVATRAATNSGTPLWLSEGFADWVGYHGTGRTARQVAPELARDVAAGRTPRTLPANADFGTTATGLAQAYEGGWLACRMVEADWGAGKLVALYRAVGTGGGTDAAMRSTLGIGLDDFTARWRAYVQRELA
ncbi:MAG: hypothetical protein QOF44_6062 [Streptomyces sp.]|nr:hypothetical protein [Streptomyces sp.]